MSKVFNFVQDVFVVYNNKVTILKWYVIPPITDSMIPLGNWQNNEHVINFITGDMRYKFEAFSNNKMNSLYLAESMQP